MRFDLKSFIIFVIIFLIEVCIALFVDDKIIRPYGGDFLVVIMIYYFLKTFIETKIEYLLLFVLCFAYAIELAQLLNVVEVFGIENKVARVVIGTSFSWGDLIAYTLGVLCCFVVEKRLEKKEIA